MTIFIMPSTFLRPERPRPTTTILLMPLKKHLARALAEGFAYQGEISPQTGEPRGVKSTGQPPVAFVDFIQNHDQVGNRAQGDRLITLAGR